MTTHSSILAQKIPYTGEAGRLQPLGFQSLTRLSTHATHHLYAQWLGLSTPPAVTRIVAGGMVCKLRSHRPHTKKGKNLNMLLRKRRRTSIGEVEGVGNQGRLLSYRHQSTSPYWRLIRSLVLSAIENAGVP